MEESTYVEGVPDSAAKMYSGEYMRVACKLLDIFPAHVNVPEKFTAEKGKSGYIRQRYGLQKRFEGAVQKDDARGAWEAAKGIMALRDPYSYMRNDFLEMGMCTPMLARNLYAHLSGTDSYASPEECASRMESYGGMQKNVLEYALLTNRS